MIEKRTSDDELQRARDLLACIDPTPGETRTVLRCDNCGNLVGRRYIPRGLGYGSTFNPCGCYVADKNWKSTEILRVEDTAESIAADREARSTGEFRRSPVPERLWGRDHWAMLAYVESRLVDEGRYRVWIDPRVRQNLRNWMLLAERNGGRSCGSLVMEPEHGSRLADGRVALDHDDWDCVYDMLVEGVFAGGLDDFDAGFELQLTDVGRILCENLREHKQRGGTWASFHRVEPSTKAASQAARR